MKHIISLFIVTLVITSCGGDKNQSLEELLTSNNLEQIRKKKSELDAQQATISDQLKQIEDKIKALDPQEKVPLITTLATKEEVFKHFLELQGNVKTKQNIVIFPEMAGTLQKVYVKEGQSVKKGQTLAKIDDGGLAQQVAQLQIQADLAKTTYERQQRLWEQKIGSEDKS